mmetsp:Transcript_17209/g.32691  ORF Transcript_17209/g.32691 Transcript_17209/m.32691 type:complete len:171 (-) Transcript_17209:267-779(-)
MYKAGKSFAKLPRRKTDSSVVVKTAKYAMGAYLDKGEAAAVRRAGGLERQYRLKCRECGLNLGYSSTPFDKPMKTIFFLAEAIKYIPNGEANAAAGPTAADKWRARKGGASSSAAATAECSKRSRGDVQDTGSTPASNASTGTGTERAADSKEDLLCATGKDRPEKRQKV